MDQKKLIEVLKVQSQIYHFKVTGRGALHKTLIKEERVTMLDKMKEVYKYVVDQLLDHEFVAGLLVGAGLTLLIGGLL